MRRATRRDGGHGAHLAPRGLARVTGGGTTAAPTVDLLGSIFSYAVRKGLRPDNPAARFKRPPARRRDRVLLRHGYASVTLDLGYSELTIADLFGHRLHSVTSCYATASIAPS